MPQKTLWQLLHEKKVKEQPQIKPLEFRVPNPINARVGDMMTVDVPDLKGLNLQIVQFRSYTRRIGAETFNFGDYDIAVGDRRATIRVNPTNDPDAYAQKHASVLLLKSVDEFAYDDTLYKEVLPVGTFEVRDDKGQLTASYDRLNGVNSSYIAEVTLFKERGGNSFTHEVEYWDFARDLSGFAEYYFVEMAKDTGWFQMYTGSEILDSDIQLFELP